MNDFISRADALAVVQYSKNPLEGIQNLPGIQPNQGAKMRIAGTLPVSFCNGEGARYVVFLQGCNHRCKGCQNPDTWDFLGGKEVDVADIAADFLARKHLDGITLSGGDPFFQQEECIALLDLLPDVNVWIYTGFEYEDICNTELAKRADVLVVGKFVEELKCEGEMYGSNNQRIIRNRIKQPAEQKVIKNYKKVVDK